MIDIISISISFANAHSGDIYDLLDGAGNKQVSFQISEVVL